nr:fatty-acid-binding protein 2 isoform X1 [Tanacetum cinerariifolium]
MLLYLVPPLGNASRNFFAVSHENKNAVVERSINHSPCEVEQRRCGDIKYGSSNCLANVHPYDVCNKLGSKYASLPDDEVKTHDNFFSDLLREDISMTLRLVVSCNGIKISTVRDAFEKSLQARLIKVKHYVC